MSTRSTTSIRRARETDAPALSAVFDAAWREAYRGIIPGIALERLISQRDGRWWRGALRRGRPIAVVETPAGVVGYAAYGRARSGALKAEGEIDELYLAPEYQGLGLGRRLFRAVRNDLGDHGLPRVGVWSLEENERAATFYEGLGGIAGPRTLDRIAGVRLAKVGYLFR
ncbi:GNAT family N-acetyltransferase [Methylobacterium oxalidis]|uniref:N-acetyltransferase GCN5 n=1 Tax=Methylobacterium oxalidis TaxID=944322 RepID=A0A512IW70_9HYPH|nr:GNAT family N-acetyltransferase [Methylobacterium oxalidis]GEP01971.1 N-acetyltransferase GCN5 [Methylobacterium oxalidis]GJE35689.1 hypothetical protein LDDCCGHA_5909 [Methylobacterium oxalidis]GLS61916.1 N-acetyltransferase GCN5 [Methylobacterium oxalidis]